MESNIKYIQIDNGSVYKSSVAEEKNGVIGRAIASQISKEDAAFICKAVNNHDSLLEALKSITYQYKEMAKIYCADNKVIFMPDQFHSLLQAQATIKKAETK